MKKIIVLLLIAASVSFIGCIKSSDFVKPESKKQSLYFQIESVDKDGKVNNSRVIVLNN
jgi:hypothetical protein